MSYSVRKTRLIELLEAPIQALGYELVDLEAQTGGRGLLRIYIDREEGVDVGDCEAVSHQISGVLDVEDPMPGEYVLEVSSPGIDRPLRTVEHFKRFRDHSVRVKLGQAQDGRRNFKGMLLRVENDEIFVEVDKETFRIPLAEIASAQLVSGHQ